MSVTTSRFDVYVRIRQQFLYSKRRNIVKQRTLWACSPNNTDCILTNTQSMSAYVSILHKKRQVLIHVYQGISIYCTVILSTEIHWQSCICNTRLNSCMTPTVLKYHLAFLGSLVQTATARFEPRIAKGIDQHEVLKNPKKCNVCFTQDKQICFFFGFLVLMSPHYSPPQATRFIHFIPTSMYDVQQQLRGIIHGMILRRHEDHHMFIPARQMFQPKVLGECHISSKTLYWVNQFTEKGRYSPGQLAKFNIYAWVNWHNTTKNWG